MLGSGQTQHITLTVPISNLSRWDEKLRKQVVVDGAYQFKVGLDSAHIFGSQLVEIAGSLTPGVSYVTVEPDQVIFQPGETLDLSGRNPWIANDTQKGSEQPHAARGQHRRRGQQRRVVRQHGDRPRHLLDQQPERCDGQPRRDTDRGLAPAWRRSALPSSGVTGSTPIVVQQPFSVTAPSIVPAGTTFTATTTLPNTGSAPSPTPR